VFLSFIASQLTSRHLTTNPAIILSQDSGHIIYIILIYSLNNNYRFIKVRYKVYILKPVYFIS
jgi:hypothetical protein